MAATENLATPSQPESFKEQLDRAADETRTGSNKPNPVVEKITEYVPAAAKILGVQSDPHEPNKPEIPGPPERPHHDDKIEEFMRDQHRSKGKDSMLNGENKRS